MSPPQNVDSPRIGARDLLLDHHRLDHVFLARQSAPSDTVATKPSDKLLQD